MADAADGCTLSWEQLQYVVHKGHRKKERVVLDSVNGSIAPHQLLAIMGFDYHSPNTCDMVACNHSHQSWMWQ